MESQGQPCLKGLPPHPPRATANQNDTDQEHLPKNKRQLEHSCLPRFKKQNNDVTVSTRMEKSNNIPSVLLDEDEEDENVDKTTILPEGIQVQSNLDRSAHCLPEANGGTEKPSSTILTSLIQDETERKLVQNQIKVFNNCDMSLAEDKCTKEATPLDSVAENSLMSHYHGDISKEKDLRLSTIETAHLDTKNSSTIIIPPTGHENVYPIQSSAVAEDDTGLEYSDISKQVVSNCGTQSNSELNNKDKKSKVPIKLDLDNLQLLNVGGGYIDTLPSIATMASSNQDSVIESADVQNTDPNKSLSQSQPGSTQSTIILNSNSGNQKPNDIEAIPIHVYPQGQGISLVTSSGILTADISTFSSQVPAILTEGDADDADSTANFSEQFHIVTTSNIHPGNPQIPGQSSNEMLSVMMSSSDLSKSVILTTEQQQAILGEVMTPGVAGGQTLHITIPNVTTSGHQPIVTGSDGNLLCGDHEGVDGGQVRAIQVQLLQTNEVHSDNKGTHEERGKNRSCPHQDCGKVCHRASKLKMPMMANSGERPYKCPHEGCDWAFATAYKLKRHERGHTGERPFLCHFEGCNRRFTTAYNLKTHTRAHDRTNIIQCQYEGCDKAFPSLHKYRIHERRHQQDDKPFKCEVHGCGKEFSAMSTLASHLKSHSGERPHGCPVEGCEKRFTKASKLKLHLRTHTGERPFACDVEGCGWSFTSAYKLKRHMRKHTGERPFICTYEGCHKSFTRSSHLKTHTLVHTGEKPYVCPIEGCNKAFTAGSSLNVHMRKHTGEKPFRCEEDGCSKAYTTASNLRAHQKRHDKTQRIIEGSQEQTLPPDFVTVNTMSSTSNSSSLVDNDRDVTYTGINSFTSEDFANDDVTTIPVSVHFPPGSLNTIGNNAGNPLTLSTAGTQDHSDSTEEQGKGHVTTVTLPVANLDVDGGPIGVSEFSDNVEPMLQSHEVSKHSDGDHLKHDGGFDLSITSIVSHLQSHDTSPSSKLNSSDVLGSHRGERLLIDGKLRTLEFRTPGNPEDQFKPPAVIFQEEKSGSSDTEGDMPQTHSDLPATSHGLMQITLPQDVIQIHFPPNNSPVPPIRNDNEMESTVGHHQLQAFEASSLSELQGNNLNKAQISQYMEDDSPDRDDNQVDNYPESTINLQDLR